MAETAATAGTEREADPGVEAEAGGLAAAGVAAFAAWRNGTVATHAPDAQAYALAAQAAAAATDR